ncbi:siderophore-interacting protein [Glycomyces sp. A-F 0318]|uniref:siderophore-interacting protein n=1 Tax=Glycomyces amatae TaxID=2881355 RepID=UPI001E2D1277|nr:siderophore-interacting protein [Glycomyces amatae]MCD0445670.1 siderophore-interacting protein [Glycomyces amatae]
MGHGWEGAVLKLFRAKDFKFTVTGAEQVTEHYRRLTFTDGGLLAALGVHPTMWVRLWFDNDGRPHQRGYTLVDPDVENGAFAIEFALHDGCASDWSRTAKPGDVIEASVQGTGFTEPDPSPERLLVVGDAASLPAINSLLDAFPETPATIWFETADDDELPFRVDPIRHDLRKIARGEDGAALLEQVREELPHFTKEPERIYLWIAAEAKSTRALTAFARKELGVPKQRAHTLAYWRAA